jgi:hypothetical protein
MDYLYACAGASPKPGFLGCGHHPVSSPFMGRRTQYVTRLPLCPPVPSRRAYEASRHPPRTLSREHAVMPSRRIPSGRCSVSVTGRRFIQAQNPHHDWETKLYMYFETPFHHAPTVVLGQPAHAKCGALFLAHCVRIVREYCGPLSSRAKSRDLGMPPRQFPPRHMQL